MKRTPSPKPGSDAWVEQRRHGIFATDAATVTGRNPFASPFDKFAELQGTSMPKVATDAMEWGVLLQPLVGAAWARKHDRKVRANPWTYWYEDGIGSHFDFDVVPPKGQPVTEIVEVKTASAFASRDWGEQNTDQVPEAYALQCQHEMMCRGPLIRRCYLGVLLGGQKFQSYVVERIDEMIADLLNIERRFLQNALAGIAPPMDGSEAATSYLRGLNPKDKGDRWDLPDSVENLALGFLSARAAEASATAEKDMAANRLREAMADHAAGIGRLVKVSYRNTKDRATINWQEAALALGADPTIIARHTTVSPGTRPLIVTFLDAP